MCSAPGCDEGAVLGLRKEAAAALLSYVKHPENCQTLISAPSMTGGKALTSIFETCGDFLLQLDLLEILYNCAVSQGEAGGPSSLPKTPFTSQITALAAKSDPDLNADLRKALMAYNRKLGKRAMSVSHREYTTRTSFAHLVIFSLYIQPHPPTIWAGQCAYLSLQQYEIRNPCTTHSVSVINSLV